MLNPCPSFSWLMDRLWHLVLPVICLTYGGLAYLSRLTRAEMLEVIREDYVRTARAKGLSERVVIFKHAFRNALLPIVTLLAFLLPAMFGGSVIIESIFSVPGMGQLGFEAVLSRDYPGDHGGHSHFGHAHSCRIVAFRHPVRDTRSPDQAGVRKGCGFGLRVAGSECLNPSARDSRVQSRNQQPKARFHDLETWHLTRNPKPDMAAPHTYWQMVWHHFKKRRSSLVGLCVTLFLFFVAILAPFLANERPILLRYQGEFHWPVFSGAERIGPYTWNELKKDVPIVFQWNIEGRGDFAVWPLVCYSPPNIICWKIWLLPAAATGSGPMTAEGTC